MKTKIMIPMALLSLSSPQLLANDDAGFSLEEIVVTAQRRAENLQDIPVAVSAMSSAMIERKDVHNIDGIASNVPGLSFAPFSPGQNVISLRGASSNDDGAGTDNSVAVFVDDIYLGRVSNINPEMFDLERIEVLRGPQGTLYGKNTIGGAINVVSKKPNLQEVEGKLHAGVGNYSASTLAGYVTGPLSDNWAAKAAVSYRKRDGWADNVITGQELKDDDRVAVRGQLLYSDDGFEALLSADYNRLDVADMGRVPVDTGYDDGVNVDPAVWVGPYLEDCPGADPDCVAGPTEGYAKQKAWGVSARLSWSLENGELVSITGYRDSESDWNMDSTGSRALPLIDDILDETQQFSQELRWVADWSDGLNTVAGLWFLNEETDRTECFDLSPGSDCTDGLDGSDLYRQVNETTGYAAFGQLNWSLSESLRLTLGARYSYEEKEIENHSTAGNFVVINETFDNEVSESWSAFTPKASLAYEFGESGQVYFSVASGFKSGGFAAAPTTQADTQPLDQEEALSYELGLKTEIGGVLRLNAALFRTEYEDLQIQSFGPRDAGASFGTFQTFNAGDAEVNGFEVEFTWAPMDNLMVSGFYGYMDSEFTDLTVPNASFPNQSGEDMIRTPENKYSLSVEYILSLQNRGDLSMSVDYSYTDEQREELEPWAVRPEFDTVNARVTWNLPGDSLSLSLWGKNLADEEYITHMYTIASSVVAVYGDPRTYGASLDWRF
ncbi:TonB-dependent receptor [Pseudomaricurvus alkylphenolicus]|uniref:TonB-dependent receptor n=1 Tax=Pseudomaricurvus alkylphenolicus TaxID=1306991 RepID=UPI00142463E2|nr:TonB-dependent receptor [Pseudomaricurvus alkylphenolicus]NIB40374.1 TonB-dependent receptor [Pseudomaricurvus alkylphenolicus]